MTESKKFEVNCEIAKVDESLGLVFGWAIVCKIDGEEYFDLQGDHIPEDSMMKAAADFMENSRRADDLHARKGAGSLVFAFPLTEETAKAFGLVTNKTGLMIAMKPDETMMAKFASGEYKGFSIGGTRLEDIEVGN